MRTTKNKPSEKIGEDNTQYEFRCHQCGGDFMAAGIFIDGFASSSILLLNPKECPNCGSKRIVPVLFEDGVVMSRDTSTRGN